MNVPQEHVDRARLHANVKRTTRRIELLEIELTLLKSDLKEFQEECDHHAWKGGKCAVCFIPEART